MATFKGVLFAFLLVISSLFYSFLFIIPSILILPLSTEYSRILYERLFQQQFTGFYVAIVELVYQTKIVISGDFNRQFSTTRPTLIIINHPCRIDWFYSWCLISKLGSLAQMRTVTRKIFENMPIIGWVFSLGAQIFVQQSREEDEKTIRESVQYYKESSLPVQLVLFPEGGPPLESRKKKDNEYAMKKGMELYQYIQHPRTRGFIKCVNALKIFEEFDIFNVSLGYVGKISNTWTELMKGHLPSEIHFNVERVPYSEFSLFNDEQLEEWVQEKWRAKEHQLKAFSQNNSFNSSPILKDDWTTSFKLIGYLLYGLISCVLFFYYLPWTLLFAVFFSAISLYVHKFKGGWSRVLLNRNTKKH